MEPLIQVAGIKSAREAAGLLALGIRWLGFPLRLPVNQADTTEAEAAAIVAGLPAGAIPVLITYETTARAVDDFCREVGVRHVQLHGPVSPAELEKLRRLRGPDLFVIKSLVVGRGPAVALEAELRQSQPWVDAFITDSHDPRTGADGATGQVHDWSVSRRLVKLSCRPVILAGGLTPDNVREAILAVRPAGVDAHTGLEDARGDKDFRRVERFLREALLAFQTIKTTP